MDDLIYFISLLNQLCVVWDSGLPQENITDLERTRKTFCKMVLKEKYLTYPQALATLRLQRKKTKPIAQNNEHLIGVFCMCSGQILQFYFKSNTSMKYILRKHKPKNSGWYLFTATTALKGYENHKDALTAKITSHRAKDVFGATSA